MFEEEQILLTKIIWKKYTKNLQSKMKILSREDLGV